MPHVCQVFVIRHSQRHLRTERPSSRLPYGTAEIVQAFGNPELFKCDFSLVNAHCLFAGIYDPKNGADWAANQINALIDLAPPKHQVLVREIGWPSSPAPFSDNDQRLYWEVALSSPVAKKANIFIFDGLGNVAWKNEPLTMPDGSRPNVGPRWPVLFASDRQPKPYATELLKLWLESRPAAPKAKGK